MHSDSSKRHELSPRPSRKFHHHFRRGIRIIKVIKYRPSDTPREDINSNPNANLRHNSNTSDSPEIERGFFPPAFSSAEKSPGNEVGSWFDLTGHFVTFINI